MLPEVQVQNTRMDSSISLILKMEMHSVLAGFVFITCCQYPFQLEK